MRPRGQAQEPELIEDGYPIRMLARGEIGNQHLIRSGVAVAAVVVRVERTSIIMGGRPVYRFDLEVRPAGAPPYRVQHRTPLPERLRDGVGVGQAFSVHVDPADAAMVAIDWRALMEETAPVPRPATGRVPAAAAA